MDYGEKTTKKGNARKGKPVGSRLAFDDTKQEAEKKARKSTGKMTDAQKTALNKHMVKMEKGGMTKSEMKSHRMKLMGRMRKGMSVGAAHKDVMKA
jgi:hypothetical protein